MLQFMPAIHVIAIVIHSDKAHFQNIFVTFLHYFFFNPPAHLCAVTYMTEISLIVTLNNQFTLPYLHYIYKDLTSLLMSSYKRYDFYATNSQRHSQFDPREDAGGLCREYSSVSPACRKRRLKGRRYIAIVADTA